MSFVHRVEAAYEIVASVTIQGILTKFKAEFRNPQFFKAWDHYIKNPELPEEDIPDFYGDMDDDGLDDPLQMVDNALEKIGSPEKAKAYVKKAFTDFTNDFKSSAKFKNNLLVVYRTVTTHGDNEELIENFKEPDFNAGLYWSWKPEPSAHWGGRGRVATMTGLVDLNGIDIQKTLVKNLHPTLGEEETEMELKPRAKVIITQLNEGRRNVLWKGRAIVKAQSKHSNQT